MGSAKACAPAHPLRTRSCSTEERAPGHRGGSVKAADTNYKGISRLVCMPRMSLIDFVACFALV